ncbi:hypothetical protein [Bacillus cereus]|uniref:hypothetical protein n=1 Tax=Bacillus cereus TaxID=1396 RepID=UPI000BF94042|nr:hypothetical protein [Bacillus cereus]PEQ29616.1 hypothetical protein CN466_22975 [Bacillus cereus]
MGKIKLCTQMPTEDLPNASEISSKNSLNTVHLELVSENKKLWKPGTVLKVSFLDGKDLFKTRLYNLLKNGKTMQTFSLILAIIKRTPR